MVSRLMFRELILSRVAGRWGGGWVVSAPTGLGRIFYRFPGLRPRLRLGLHPGLVSCCPSGALCDAGDLTGCVRRSIDLC
jgi:hypothetical protein